MISNWIHHTCERRPTTNIVWKFFSHRKRLFREPSLNSPAKSVRQPMCLLIWLPTQFYVKILREPSATQTTAHPLGKPSADPKPKCVEQIQVLFTNRSELEMIAFVSLQMISGLRRNDAVMAIHKANCKTNFQVINLLVRDRVAISLAK